MNDLPHAPVWQALLAAAPAAAAALAALALSARPDAAPASAWRLARAVSSAMLALALAGLVGVGLAGPAQGWGLRADAIGGSVALLVSFLGWVIVRYSQTYLDGEPRARRYAVQLLTALAAVLLVVSSNHLLVLALAWTATSLALHGLLRFFDDRPAALMAAHKKFVLGRVADAAMLGACALLATAFGTLRIDSVLAQAAAAPALPLAAQAAVVLVTLAVILKTAALPFHGWLIQVMEAPTPVSALLHAGVVNLGGFVLIRLAPLVAEVPLAAGLLVVAGAFTAVVAALVMTTRISIKVALAWSTCAQMGFMLMQCGLGLWEIALLHLVAHSLYKAHAFLAAGGVVRQTLVGQLAKRPAAPAAWSLTLAAAVTLALTGLVAVGFGTWTDSPPALWVMAGIVALSLTPMLAGAHAAGAAAVARGAALAALLAIVYFALHALLQGHVAPADAVPADAWWLVPAVAFAGLFVLQSVIALRPQGALARSLYPWFYGGLFLDEWLSRRLWRVWPAPRPARPAPQVASAWSPGQG
jgi:NAD(P)H-quinone oxidoreductase subunit 5